MIKPSGSPGFSKNLATFHHVVCWNKNVVEDWFWLVLTIFVFFGASLTWRAPPCRCQTHRCFLFELDFFRRRPSWKDWKTQAAQPHSTRNRSSSFDSCGPVTCSTDTWFGSVSLLLFLQRNLVDAGCSGYFSYSCLSFLIFEFVVFRVNGFERAAIHCARMRVPRASEKVVS